MARQPWGAGFPRAGAGKILPRPRRTVGGEKAGRPEPYTGGTGARAPAWTVLQVLVALVLDVSSVLARTRHPSLGVHPLAVGHAPGSGLGPAGEGGAPYCLNDLHPRGQVC